MVLMGLSVPIPTAHHYFPLPRFHPNAQRVAQRLSFRLRATK